MVGALLAALIIVVAMKKPKQVNVFVNMVRSSKTDPMASQAEDVKLKGNMEGVFKTFQTSSV